ncbi:MAG: TonB-dependent receptor [Melioribacteraceae bacterium]|nr:TonB-dependent receptor [Melioribacteraceae bacterium]
MNSNTQKQIVKTLFTFVFLVSFSLLSAQGKNVTISGLITDATTGDQMIGANILVYKDSIDIDNPPFKGTSSNRYGFYVIPNVSKGNYFIIFRSIGFKSKIEEVNITVLSGSLSLNVKMEQEDVELQEIIVRDKKMDDVGLSTIDISPELLQMLPSFSGEVDIFKTLQMLPGVKVASDMSTGLYVRGGSPDQNLTLVDGMVVYSPAHLGNIASSFNSNAVHDIRLIKGAYPAEYGGRLSSILDIKLRGGTKEKEKGTVGVGTIISHGTLEGPISEKATYMISSRVMYYDLYQQNFNNDGSTPRYNFFDLNGKINYNISDNEIISVSGNFNSDYIYSPTSSEDFNYDIKWSNTSFNLNWLNITTSSLLINTNLSYINFRTKTTLDDIKNDSLANDYFSSSDLKDLIAKTNLEYKWDDSHTLKTGFELALHFYNLINRDFYDPVLEVSPDYSEDLLLTEASFFIQDEWAISPILNTNFGVRLFYVKESNSLLFEPRLSASLAITSNLFFKGAYAVTNQFLHLIIRNDITLPTDLWFPSTKNTLPSRSEQFVTGFDAYFSEKEYLLSVEAYYRNMDNLYEFKEILSYDRSESIEELFTVGKGEAYGIELFINKRAGNLTGWIGYTLSWTRRQFDNLNAGNIFYPRYDRRHDVSVVLAYKFSEVFTMGLTWAYATGQGYTMPTAQYSFTPLGVIGDRDERTQFNYTRRNEYKLPAYHKMDLSFNYKFEMLDLPAEAYLTLYNLYNQQNPFAHYVAYDEEDEVAKIKQITLMPFIPTFGISFKF